MKNSLTSLSYSCSKVKTDGLLKYVQGKQIDDLSNVAEELLDVKSKEKSETLIAAVELCNSAVSILSMLHLKRRSS